MKKFFAWLLKVFNLRPGQVPPGTKFVPFVFPTHYEKSTGITQPPDFQPIPRLPPLPTLPRWLKRYDGNYGLVDVWLIHDIVAVNLDRKIMRNAPPLTTKQYLEMRGLI